MNTEIPSWLTEKYISKCALPQEVFLSWLKWDPQLDFDTIVIKSQADVEWPDACGLRHVESPT